MGFFTFTRRLCSVLYISKQEKRKTRDFVLWVCFTDGHESRVMRHVNMNVISWTLSATKTTDRSNVIRPHPTFTLSQFSSLLVI